MVVLGSIGYDKHVGCAPACGCLQEPPIQPGHQKHVICQSSFRTVIVPLNLRSIQLGSNCWQALTSSIKLRLDSPTRSCPDTFLVQFLTGFQLLASFNQWYKDKAGFTNAVMFRYIPGAVSPHRRWMGLPISLVGEESGQSGCWLLVSIFWLSVSVSEVRSALVPWPPSVGNEGMV